MAARRPLPGLLARSAGLRDHQHAGARRRRAHPRSDRHPRSSSPIRRRSRRSWSPSTATSRRVGRDGGSAWWSATGSCSARVRRGASTGASSSRLSTTIASRRGARSWSTRPSGCSGDWVDRDVRDVHADMSALTLAIVGRTLLDSQIGPADVEEVRAAAATLTDHFDSRFNSLRFFLPDALPTPGNRRMRAAVERLDRIVYRLIAARRAAGERGDDAISMLLEASEADSHPLTDRELRDEVMTLFMAGHETTAVGLDLEYPSAGREPGGRGCACGGSRRCRRWSTADSVAELPAPSFHGGGRLRDAALVPTGLRPESGGDQADLDRRSASAEGGHRVHQRLGGTSAILTPSTSQRRSGRSAGSMDSRVDSLAAPTSRSRRARESASAPRSRCRR